MAAPNGSETARQMRNDSGAAVGKNNGLRLCSPGWSEDCGCCTASRRDLWRFQGSLGRHCYLIGMLRSHTAHTDPGLLPVSRWGPAVLHYAGVNHRITAAKEVRATAHLRHFPIPLSSRSFSCRDLLLHTLHHVGALPCGPDTPGCWPGCRHDSTNTGIPPTAAVPESVYSMEGKD